jgi:hypothetical protein
MDDELDKAYRMGLQNGMIEAVRMLAVWKDGVQVVGVMREPLRDVITGIMNESRHDKYPGGGE